MQQILQPALRLVLCILGVVTKKLAPRGSRIRNAEHALRIVAQPDRANPHPVLEWPRDPCLRMLGSHHRALRIVQHLGRR